MDRENDSPEQSKALPRHIAVIMDGNNRWANSHGLPGFEGHRAGAESAREIVQSCVRRNIGYLTLFAFSSENWLRPDKEVRGLMALFLAVFKRKEIQQMHQDNVRLQFIGNRHSFSARLQRHMNDVEVLTRDNTGTVVTVAADYGGQWDIANASRCIAEEVQAGRMRPEEVTTDTIQRFISLGDSPMPDLCIRTGGEYRISNFLLWQLAYTELYFTDCYWPDFGDRAFQAAMDDFSRRQRRYGRLHSKDGGSDERMHGDERVA